MFNWNYLVSAIGVAFALVGIFFFGWLQILQGTNKLLKEQNEELKSCNADLSEKHNKTLQVLAGMQGQIDVLKSIPLQSIDCTLAKILTNLELTATTLARNTEVIAKAVERVKEDLSHEK